MEEEPKTYGVKGIVKGTDFNINLAEFDNIDDANSFIRVCFNESLHNNETYYLWNEYHVEEKTLSGKILKILKHLPDYENKILNQNPI
jgi:hypothetical protein